MSWLVTGGAGYIGAHVARAFRDAEIDVVVFDDLSSGRREFVPDGVPFVRGDVRDGGAIMDLVARYHIGGVVHLAGFKYAGVSVHQPLHTYSQNVEGTRMLLGAMQETGVKRMVFSSSAAVYGTPQVELVTEETATTPESPYGESKLIGEWLMRDQGIAVGLEHVSLRYFNVVGTGAAQVADTSPHNLFPLIFDALLDGRVPKINGDDYPTPDGTAVRDYVHVSDIALAHVTAAERLDAGQSLEAVYNLGSGHGSSVAEIMTAVSRVTRHRVRSGDRAASRGRPASDRRER